VVEVVLVIHMHLQLEDLVVVVVDTPQLLVNQEQQIKDMLEELVIIVVMMETALVVEVPVV
jgi:hypothetical protein